MKMFKRLFKRKLDPYYNGPVSGFFGLSYASYYCVPRSILQAMPEEWQEQFVKLVSQIPVIDIDYVITAKDKKGKFTSDPLADYVRPKML
jgi:nicotinamidase-related amidase